MDVPAAYRSINISNLDDESPRVQIGLRKVQAAIKEVLPMPQL